MPGESSRSVRLPPQWSTSACEISTSSIRRPSRYGAMTVARHVAQAGVDQQRALRRRRAGTGRRSARRGRPRCGGCRVRPPCWDDAAMAERTPLSELLIVDADVHVHESPGALAPYCDPPWDVALRSVADVPERYLDIPGFSPGGDGTLTARFPTSHEATRMVHTPEQMVERAARDRRRPRGAVPRPPAEDRGAAAGRLRRRARARLQRVADRGVDVAPPGAARRDRGLPAGPRGRGARDRAPRRPPPSPSTSRAPGLDPLWGHRRYDPIYDAAQNAGLPVLLHAVTVTSPGVPVQQPRLRHRVRAPLDVAHVLDHRQRDQHGLHRRRRALPGAADRRDRGRHLLDAVRLQPARQGVPRAPPRGAVPDRAPEPLRQAHLRRDAADRGARAPARTSSR